MHHCATGPWPQGTSGIGECFSVIPACKEYKLCELSLGIVCLFVCFCGRLLTKKIGYPYWDLASHPGLA